ncbi:hypothetical protein VTK26DRAFT_4490 [Humicola hyalothermophila]
MAHSTLPTFPMIIFGIVEPFLLTWAYVTGIRDPASYFAKQIPGPPGSGGSAAAAFPPEAASVTLQLVNVLLLLAPMAVVCCFSRDPATARGYLFAVALADYGHMYAIYRAVGHEVFFDVARWNDMVAGGIGVSAVLNVLRWTTLLGVFGPIDGRRASGALVGAGGAEGKGEKRE